MNNTNPLFSIVICTFNGVDRLERCLQSIDEIDFDKSKFEVIVVDDGSTDETATKVKKFPATYIRHEKNLGIASSRNTGLRASRGEFIVCLDDDCEVNSIFLKSIEKKYKNPLVMGVAANLVYPSDLDLTNLYFASMWYGIAVPAVKKEKRNFLDRLIWYYSNLPWGKIRNGYADNAEIIDVPGACASYRAELLNSVGGWDDQLINSGEDNDLTIRMRKAFPKMKIVLAVDAEVTHYQDLSFFGTIMREFNRRNAKYLFFQKHKLIPSVFPNPVIYFCLFPLYIYMPLLAIVFIFILYPWWIIRAIKEKNPKFVLMPIMQLFSELISNITILISLARNL